MKIAVTGGAGFIGSHLARQLLDEGHDVMIADNFTGDSVGRVPPAARLVEMDVSDVGSLADALDGYDATMHLASSVLIRGGHQDTRKDTESGLGSTQAALEAARLAGVPRFCFASSANVYGDQGLRQPIPEDAPLRPMNLYGAAKAGGEALVSAYAHLFGLSARVFRLAIVMGSGLKRGVVHDFVARLKKDPERLTVLGNGRQTKSYVAVEDCVSAMTRLGLDGGDGFDVFNVAAEGALSVVEVAKETADALRLHDVRIVPETDAQQGWPGDIPHVELSVEKARTSGWEPKFTPRQAVRRAACFAADNG